MIRRLAFVIFVVLLSLGPSRAEVMPGYTLHFNFIRSEGDARRTVAMAAAAGARMVSLVPPAHVWEDPAGLRALDAAIDEAGRRGLQIVFSRLDATQTGGEDWVFAHALTAPARMADGTPSKDWFCATVGNRPFERWQNDETRYYSRRYGRLPNLRAAAIGGMVEPFVSQRGSLLQWSEKSQCYEIAQYTPQGREEWHRWLRARFGTVKAINREYRAHFAGLGAVPMPAAPNDARFGRPRAAYFDLAACLNDWFLRQYRANRALWRQHSTVPFVLQLSAMVADKIAAGRPEFAAFDLPSWLDEADAIGVSLYTHVDYPDWAHGVDAATLQLLAGAREGGRPAIVMESGCEAPTVTADAHELSFATRMGLLLDPWAYVYEYFRYSRDGKVDPGMMVSPAGARNEPGYSAVTEALSGLAASSPATGRPCFYTLSVPRTARESELAGRVNQAIYRLAGYVPCRMLPWRRWNRVPAGAVLLLPPGVDHAKPRSELAVFLAAARARQWRLVSDASTCAALARMIREAHMPRGEAPLGIKARAGAGPKGIAASDAPETGAFMRPALFRPLPLQPLLCEQYSDNEALDLLEALRQVPEFPGAVAAQPVEPRPHLEWVQAGRRLLVWVEDDQPVVLHKAALHGKIDSIWCSTRSSKPASVCYDGDVKARLSVPCREWWHPVLY